MKPVSGRRRTGYGAGVITHLDMAGTSGATYRFRLVSPGDLPAHSGNYVLVRNPADRREVVACGTALSLSKVAAQLDANDRDTLSIFVRLNVSRETRESEHLDIVGRLSPDVAVKSLD
jgi:hypothetical protein